MIEFFNESTPEPYSSDGGSMGALIFLVIFFGIIIVLIIVAIIGSKKDKNEKLLENDKRKKARTQAENSRMVIFGSLMESIKRLEKDLEEFKPSVGIKSLGDINREFSNIIKNIKSSEEINSVYKSEDFKTELKQIIDELDNSKPSNWSKEASFSIGLIKAKVDAFYKNEENKKGLEEGKNKKWN
ncbi:MAG: hypothetical protein TYPL_1320 [Candidatus Tyloplasma litorale]|nr:MAG: hypothetical protein TYPL_1320 [Mycoplasmatales bacterium]